MCHLEELLQQNLIMIKVSSDEIRGHILALTICVHTAIRED